MSEQSGFPVLDTDTLPRRELRRLGHVRDVLARVALETTIVKHGDAVSDRQSWAIKQLRSWLPDGPFSDDPVQLLYQT